MNIALGCVDLWFRSLARCPFAQKAVANMTSMSAVVDSSSVWHAACFRAADHSKEESLVDVWFCLLISDVDL